MFQIIHVKSTQNQYYNRILIVQYTQYTMNVACSNLLFFYNSKDLKICYFFVFIFYLNEYSAGYNLILILKWPFKKIN